MYMYFVISDAYKYPTDVVEYCLYSYSGIGKEDTFVKNIEYFFNNGGKGLLMDSGAYSLWKRNLEVDFDKYIEFCKRMITRFGKRVNIISLDVIPGKWGKGVKYDDPHKSGLKGLKNLRVMLDRGIPRNQLVHAYHQGEDISILRQILSEKIGMVGVSPANDRTSQDRCDWMDWVFQQLPKNIKTHGLGMTQVGLMARYPWSSVDSVTPIRGAAYGYCFFTPENGNPLEAYKVCLSPRAITLSKAHWHYDNLSKDMQEYVRSYIKQLGFSFKELRHRFATRALFNVVYFKSVQDWITKYPSRSKYIQPILF